MADNFITDKIKKLARISFNALKFIPDEPYLKFYYRLRTGKKLNLDNPKGYNEKLNWMKLYDRNPLYTKLADKLLVREYVEERIGRGHTIPLLGSWKSFDEIDFDKLPDAFVLKCNHDSGSVKMIKDKNSLTDADKKKLKKHFNKCMSINPWWMAREWSYKDIEPYIFAEKYMDDGELRDYKFFCFNGEPVIMFVTIGRFSANKRFDFFDMEGNLLNINVAVAPPSDVPPELPETFNEMKEYAKKLSKGLRTARIDFYEQSGIIYFGEYTFYNAGGTKLFKPDEWEIKLGNLVDIKKSKEENAK